MKHWLSVGVMIFSLAVAGVSMAASNMDLPANSGTKSATVVTKDQAMQKALKEYRSSLVKSNRCGGSNKS
jgi:hypothetical protein